MQFEELDASMKEIIMECQADFLSDGTARFTAMEQMILDWKSGNYEQLKLVHDVHLHIHSMKGVARTIYFDHLHEMTELTVTWIRQKQDHEWTSELVEQLIQSVHEMKSSFDQCKVFSN